MSNDDRAKWDQRYASGEYQPSGEPSAVVERSSTLVGSGRALVLACGTGRNALYLASQGFDVEALDVSPVAIDMARSQADRLGLSVDWRVEDLDAFEPGKKRYDLITMIRYINRSIWPKLAPALAPNGWLATELHLETRLPVSGPSQEYRVKAGELIHAFPDLRVIEYRESLSRSSEGDRVYTTASLVACAGDPGW